MQQQAKSAGMAQTGVSGQRAEVEGCGDIRSAPNPPSVGRGLGPCARKLLGDKAVEWVGLLAELGRVRTHRILKALPKSPTPISHHDHTGAARQPFRIGRAIRNPPDVQSDIGELMANANERQHGHPIQNGNRRRSERLRRRKESPQRDSNPCCRDENPVSWT